MPTPNDEKTKRFVALLGANDRSLYGFILALAPHYADADEIAQQVRMLLWEQFDNYNPEKDFGSWARAIAYYKILAFRKTSQRKHALLGQDFLESVASDFDQPAPDGEERLRAMQDCLNKLETNKRDLVLRYYSTKETMADLAAALDRTLDSVRHSILRTRMALAKCIQRSLQREGGRR